MHRTHALFIDINSNCPRCGSAAASDLYGARACVRARRTDVNPTPKGSNSRDVCPTPATRGIDQDFNERKKIKLAITETEESSPLKG